MEMVTRRCLGTTQLPFPAMMLLPSLSTIPHPSHLSFDSLLFLSFYAPTISIFSLLCLLRLGFFPSSHPLEPLFSLHCRCFPCSPRRALQHFLSIPVQHLLVLQAPASLIRVLRPRECHAEKAGGREGGLELRPECLGREGLANHVSVLGEFHTCW